MAFGLFLPDTRDGWPLAGLNKEGVGIECGSDRRGRRGPCLLLVGGCMVLDCYNFMRGRAWPANRLAQPADRFLSAEAAETKRTGRLASSKIGQRLALFVPFPVETWTLLFPTWFISARATLTFTDAEQ